ncbi:MAG: N-acetylmuramoyl-L-alanine amidase [Lachnospiraceae bacterium]|nr:N-acetylmuramoyl-L-alanine amidase [Lachnospiraceae bacterium]
MKIVMKHILCCLCAFAVVLAAAGCSKDPKTSTAAPGTLPVIGPDTSLPAESTAPSSTAEQMMPSTEKTTEAPATEAPTAAPAPTEKESTAAPTSPSPSVPDVVPDKTNFVTEGTNGYVIVIDPGHQAKGNSSQEPIGPGASQTKAKVSSGTASRFNGKAEYIVNLEVALKLREELLRRGYTVIMTRTGHNVDISNVERAQIANDANADAFVRLHCNGSENASANGIGIYYQTPSNPYNGAMHGEAKALCSALLNHMVEKTGSRADGLFERDNYSGINWSSVPGALVEMGYMTNEAEDKLLQDNAYQTKLVLGIADGIDEFLSTRKPKNK